MLDVNYFEDIFVYVDILDKVVMDDCEGTGGWRLGVWCTCREVDVSRKNVEVVDVMDVDDLMLMDYNLCGVDILCYGSGYGGLYSGSTRFNLRASTFGSSLTLTMFGSMVDF